jgi:hypothetical protein
VELRNPRLASSGLRRPGGAQPLTGDTIVVAPRPCEQAYGDKDTHSIPAAGQGNRGGSLNSRTSNHAQHSTALPLYKTFKTVSGNAVGVASQPVATQVCFGADELVVEVAAAWILAAMRFE